MKFCIAPTFGTLSIKGIGLLGTIACIPYPFGMFESMIFPTSPFGGICDHSRKVSTVGIFWEVFK